jgi:hypothetical protein
MQIFTAKIVDLMKQENLYASQGGPIILSQVIFLYFCVLKQEFYMFRLRIVITIMLPSPTAEDFFHHLNSM